MTNDELLAQFTGSPPARNLPAELATATRLTMQARAALMEEHEGDLRQSVDRLYELVSELHQLVHSW